MQFKLAIVIPAKNEEASIEGVINDIRVHQSHADIIVVNDASTDSTPDILLRLNVKTINHLQSLGAWQATQTGLLYAYARGYSHVVSMDADGQHLGSEIQYLINQVDSDEQSADVIVGAYEIRASWAKKTVWKLFRRITGIKIEDITSGFRMYNRNAMSVLITRSASIIEYQDVGVLLLLKTVGIRFREVAVKMDKRFDGKSKIFSSWFSIFYYLISTLLISFSKVFQSNHPADRK